MVVFPVPDKYLTPLSLHDAGGATSAMACASITAGSWGMAVERTALRMRARSGGSTQKGV